MKKWYNKISSDEFKDMHEKVCTAKRRHRKGKGWQKQKRPCGRRLYRFLVKNDLPFELRWKEALELNKKKS